MMSEMADTSAGEQLAFFGPPVRLWRGGPHPRSLAGDYGREGGAFVYQHCADIFFGREGIGPMRVAMDTSVLVDYAEFGEAIWSGEMFDPKVPHPEYGEELIALAEIMNLWTMRDIRLHVFDRQLTDCAGSMSDDRSALRERQIGQLQSALRCLGHDTIDMHPPAGHSWPLPADLSGLSPGTDRELVALAVDAGCHVFLTRDKALLKKVEHVARYWVALITPTGLLDALAASGELDLTAAGDFLIPDSHKFHHVMGACLSFE